MLAQPGRTARSNAECRMPNAELKIVIFFILHSAFCILHWRNAPNRAVRNKPTAAMCCRPPPRCRDVRDRPEDFQAVRQDNDALSSVKSEKRGGHNCPIVPGLPGVRPHP